MKARWTLAFFSAGIAAVAVQIPNPDVTVTGRYDGEGGSFVEGVGVCSITPETVACWNMSGNADTALSDTIRSYFQTNGYQDVSFRFGKKNRFVIIRSDRLNRIQKQLSVDNAQTWTLNNSSNGPQMEMLRCAAETSQKTVDLVLTESPPSLASKGSLEMKEGAKVTAHGVVIELGKIQLATAAQTDGFIRNYGFNGMMPPGVGGKPNPVWAIAIELTLPDPLRPMIAYRLLADNGKPINFVDERGNPVSDLAVAADNAKNAPQNSFNPYGSNRYPRAQFNVGYGPSVGNAMLAYSNVNPARVAKIEITVQESKHVLMTGFPLDPKP